jgi:hypothetical protein
MDVSVDWSTGTSLGYAQGGLSSSGYALRPIRDQMPNRLAARHNCGPRDLFAFISRVDPS